MFSLAATAAAVAAESPPPPPPPPLLPPPGSSAESGRIKTMQGSGKIYASKYISISRTRGQNFHNRIFETIVLIKFQNRVSTSLFDIEHQSRFSKSTFKFSFEISVFKFKISIQFSESMLGTDHCSAPVILQGGCYCSYSGKPRC